MDLLTIASDALEAWEFILGAIALAIMAGGLISMPFVWLRQMYRSGR